MRRSFYGRAMFRRISSSSFCSQRTAGCPPTRMHTSTSSRTCDEFGHILERTPNNIGQFSRRNRPAGPGEYCTDTQTRRIQQIGTNGSFTDGVAQHGAIGSQMPLATSRMVGETKTPVERIPDSEWMKASARKALTLPPHGTVAMSTLI